MDFQISGASISFWLKVKPRASRERLTQDASNELRLELHAAPSEGQANEACVRYFARALRIPQACVAILAGEKARRKLIRITGRSAEETIARLRALAGIGKDKRIA